MRAPVQTTSVNLSPSPDSDALERLLRMLPPGYPRGSCKPIVTPEYALAQVNCENNSDPGGPVSATYTLVRDKAALEAAFKDIVASSTRVNCPGNIQSPGPWRRDAAPQTISGVLYCGFQVSSVALHSLMVISGEILARAQGPRRRRDPLGE
jgi:hypothetical protein